MEEVSDSLYLLIRSLSKAEKRYFRVFSGNDESGAKSYLTLFDILCGMKHYDKELLNKKIKEKNLSTNLLKTRQYLFDAIIKSLIFFYSENDTEFKTRIQLMQLLVLNKKELFGLAQKKLKIFERNCVKQHRTLLLAETYAMMKTNAFNLFLNNYDNDNLHELLQKEEANLQVLMNESRFRSLTMQALTLIKDESRMPPDEVLEAYGRLEKNPLLLEAGKAKTLRSRLISLSLMSIIRFKLHKYEAALENASEYLNLLQKNKHLLKRNTFYYIVGLRNQIIALQELGRGKEVRAALEKLKKAECQNANQEVLRFRTYYTFSLLLCLSRGDHHSALQLLPDIRHGLEKFGEKIDRHSSLKLRLLMAEVLFGNGDYDESATLLNAMLGEPKIKDYPAIRIATKTLLMLCHFELGNHRLLPSLAQSILRLMKKEGFDNTFDYSFVKAFQEKNIREQTFQQLLEEAERHLSSGIRPALLDCRKLRDFLAARLKNEMEPI